MALVPFQSELAPSSEGMAGWMAGFLPTPRRGYREWL